jgi:hypothetical protein
VATAPAAWHEIRKIVVVDARAAQRSGDLQARAAQAGAFSLM